MYFMGDILIHHITIRLFIWAAQKGRNGHIQAQYCRCIFNAHKQLERCKYRVRDKPSDFEMSYCTT